MKIIFDTVEASERRMFEEALKDHTLIFLDHTIASGETLEDADIVSLFVSSALTKATIQGMPSLKLVATRSMGFDHVDQEALKEKGAVLATVPAYGTRTVAEFAFALILALSRKAHLAASDLRTRGEVHIPEYEGFDLSGKTIGIIGTGKIGKNTARIAKGFDMNVVLYDVYPDEAFAKEIACKYCTLEEVVSGCDIISLHVPYLPTTHHLINADILSKCKKGSYLINTARGAVVDTEALVSALQSGHLAGAGLDVVEGEKSLFDETALLSGEHVDMNEYKTFVAGHALVDMPNVIVTPHIAFNTTEAKREIVETTIENITGFISGTPKNTIAK